MPFRPVQDLTKSKIGRIACVLRRSPGVRLGGMEMERISASKPPMSFAACSPKPERPALNRRGRPFPSKPGIKHLTLQPGSRH